MINKIIEKIKRSVLYKLNILSGLLTLIIIATILMLNFKLSKDQLIRFYEDEGHKLLNRTALNIVEKINSDGKMNSVVASDILSQPEIKQKLSAFFSRASLLRDIQGMALLDKHYTILLNIGEGSDKNILPYIINKSHIQGEPVKINGNTGLLIMEPLELAITSAEKHSFSQTEMKPKTEISTSTIGYMVLLLSLNEFDGKMTNLIKYSMVVGLIFLLVSVFLQHRLFKYFMLPAFKIAEATDQIGLGNYKLRLNIKREDELGRLAGYFDKMAEDLDYFITDLNTRKDYIEHIISIIPSGLVVLKYFPNREDPIKVVSTNSVWKNMDPVGEILNELLVLIKKRIEDGNGEPEDQQGFELKFKDTYLYVRLRKMGYKQQGSVWLLLVIDDITNQKQIEDALRESEEKYRFFFESFIDLYYQTDMNGIITSISPSSLSLPGFKPDELIGRSITDLYPNQKQREELLDILLHKGSVNDYEVSMRNKAGHDIPVSVNSHVIYGKDGKPVMIQGTVRDISDRKRTVRALRESEDRYRRLVAAITSYTYSVEVSNGEDISRKNSTGCLSVTGYSSEDYFDDPNLWRKMIYPDDEALVEKLIDRIMSGHEVSPFEHRIVRSDGNVIWVRHTMVPHRNEEGKLIRYDGLLEDISDRKQAEEEIAKYTEQLENANRKLEVSQRELEEFIYTVSHDLKAPIVSMQGFAGLLKENMSGKLDEKSSKYLERISANAENMEALLKDLLDLSRIGRIEDESREIDLKKLVDDIFESFSVAALTKNIQLLCSDSLPNIVGRQKRIREALENLIDNAIKYMPEKEESIIEVGYDPSIGSFGDNKGAFFVRDNGEGIPEKFHEKIFNIFQRARLDKDKTSGTGVGLSIVKRVIETHGGTIWLESTPGEGATFYFNLPVFDSEEEREMKYLKTKIETIS